jgi:hypothetical protein
MPIIIVAMKSGVGKIDSINKTIHIHLSLSEVIARAADPEQSEVRTTHSFHRL